MLWDVTSGLIYYWKIANIFTYSCPATRTLIGLDFDLSRSPTVKYDGRVGLPIYDFLFEFHSNTLLNSVPLQNTRLRNLIWPFKIIQCKCDFAVDFLLVSNSKRMSVSHSLIVIGTWNISTYLLSYGQNFGQPTPTLSPSGFFAKSNHFFLDQWKWSHPKFSQMCITINPPNRANGIA